MLRACIAEFSRLSCGADADLLHLPNPLVSNGTKQRLSDVYAVAHGTICAYKFSYENTGDIGHAARDH